MKKSLKILIGIIICLVICWVTIFVIDYMMVLRCKEPIFIIASNNVDDSGSGTYKGLGYTVEMEMKLSTEYGKQISKTLISSDTYKQTSKIVTVGTKKVEKPVENVGQENQGSGINGGENTQNNASTNPNSEWPTGWDSPENPYYTGN
mgnify:CR=1 FL=1